MGLFLVLVRENGDVAHLGAHQGVVACGCRDYDGPTFRENLGLDYPTNRYAHQLRAAE